MKRQLALLVALSMLGVSVSAQSRRYGGGGITVYNDPDFRGESATFRNDTPDLRGYGLNDKVSSIDVPNGEAWEICQDINYGNRCQIISGSISNLREMGWNDRVSSLRRARGGFGGVANGRRPGGGSISSRGSQALLFFDRPDFRGSSTMISDGTSDLSYVGRPRSVQVRGGAWELCDRSGRCATVTRDVSDLAQLGLRDRLRSASLVNDRGFGNRGNQGNQGNNRNNPWWR